MAWVFQVADGLSTMSDEKYPSIRRRSNVQGLQKREFSEISRKANNVDTKFWVESRRDICVRLHKDAVHKGKRCLDIKLLVYLNKRQNSLWIKRHWNLCFSLQKMVYVWFNESNNFCLLDKWGGILYRGVSIQVLCQTIFLEVSMMYE